jgi:hypothetical protein
MTNANRDAGFECVLSEGLNTREEVSATVTFRRAQAVRSPSTQGH